MSGSQSKDLRSALQNEKNILTQRQGCQNFYVRLTLFYPPFASAPHDEETARSTHDRKSQNDAYQIGNKTDLAGNHSALPKVLLKNPYRKEGENAGIS